MENDVPTMMYGSGFDKGYEKAKADITAMLQKKLDELDFVLDPANEIRFIIKDIGKLKG